MTLSPEQEKRRQRLITIGTELYGPRWGAMLARQLGTSQSRIAMIAAGTRTISDEFELVIAGFCAGEAMRREESAQKLRALWKEIFVDHGLDQGRD